MSEKKFHAKSTALEVIKGHDLTGFETIVTGGASGEKKYFKCFTKIVISV